MVKYIILMIYLIVLCSCSSSSWTNYKVEVSSFSKTNSILENKKQSYILKNKNNQNSNPLEYEEYAKYIHNSLNKIGFLNTNNQKKADLIIEVEYGISGPKTNIVNETVPVQKYIPSQSYKYEIDGKEGEITSNSQWTTTYENVNQTETTYIRHLNLVAKSKNNNSVIWTTSISSEGYSDDLRSVLPVMIAASSDYIAKNTGKKEVISINESDKRILEIKGLNNKRLPASTSTQLAEPKKTEPKSCNQIQKLLRAAGCK
jgi:hypothetical protein